ncbi:hypothetical protein ES703_81696 [subsurface metagenome]
MTNSYHFFQTIICAHCGHEIKTPVYCGNRFCPICSRPRLARVRRRLKFLVKETKMPTGSTFKHLTLTIQNQDDLPKMLKAIVKSFRRLRQRADWKNRVSGGAFVLEVTGRPGNWHAHIHACLVAKYFPFDLLLELWKKVSTGQGVYIQHKPVSMVVSHLCKYLSKPDVPDQVMEEICAELKSYRLFQPFGCWYKLMKKYVENQFLCPECSSHTWLPSDIWYDQLIKNNLPLKCYDLNSLGKLSRIHAVA